MEYYNEQELIALCRAGNDKGQYGLYQKYADAMYNTCCRMLNDRHIAEEVMHDAFMVVFKKIDSYTFQSTLGAWIKKIVINKCIDHLRQKKLDLIELNSNHELPNEENIPNEINVKLIQEALQTLPLGYKTIFCLYAIEGYDHEEIGEILNISEQTSKSQYHRAKIKLKQQIENNFGKSNLYLS